MWKELLTCSAEVPDAINKSRNGSSWKALESFKSIEFFSRPTQKKSFRSGCQQQDISHFQTHP